MPDKNAPVAAEKAAPAVQSDTVEYCYLRANKKFYTKTGPGISVAKGAVIRRPRADVLDEWIKGDDAWAEIITAEQAAETASLGPREKAALKTTDL